MTYNKEIHINILIQNLQQTVQYNCDVADAHHASDYSLCVYLLKMREYYRWETSKTYSHELSKKSISQWLCSKESTWETLEGKDLHKIEINNIQYDPYDADLINSQINKHQYVYSSGLGLNCRPHFFLGTLIEHIQSDNFSIYISGKELARDLPAPPAFSTNGNIFIRQESVKRMIWEKVDEWKLESNHNQALAKVFSNYNLDKDLDASLDKITHNEIKAMIMHEQGEIHAQSVLGDDWQKMLADLPRSPAHFMARAVRDHIADCHTTLPELFAQSQQESIHFYFGNFSSTRKQIFPLLLEEYQRWCESHNSDTILDLIDNAYEHWCALGKDIIDCWRHYGPDSASHIEALIKRKMLTG